MCQLLSAAIDRVSATFSVHFPCVKHSQIQMFFSWFDRGPRFALVKENTTNLFVWAVRIFKVDGMKFCGYSKWPAWYYSSRCRCCVLRVNSDIDVMSALCESIRKQSSTRLTELLTAKHFPEENGRIPGRWSEACRLRAVWRAANWQKRQNRQPAPVAH